MDRLVVELTEERVLELPYNNIMDCLYFTSPRSEPVPYKYLLDPIIILCG